MNKLVLLALFAIVAVTLAQDDDDGAYDGNYDDDGAYDGTYDDGYAGSDPDEDSYEGSSPQGDEHYFNKRSVANTLPLLHRVRRHGHGHVGPVHTHVKTDYHGNFKWGVRHKVGHGYSG